MNKSDIQVLSVDDISLVQAAAAVYIVALS